MPGHISKRVRLVKDAPIKTSFEPLDYLLSRSRYKYDRKLNLIL